MRVEESVSAEDGLHVERRGKVLVVSMARGKANAINNATSRAMHRLFAAFQQDPDLLVAVLASANERIYSAGWDLKEVADGTWQPGDDEDPARGPGPGGFAGIVENWSLDKPVIAAVNGAAVGGGFEMALACDIIIASEDAFFQLPELMRGFLPEVGGMQRLPKLIPPMAAAEMLFTGRRVSVEEAQAWGLVARIVPKDRLLQEAVLTAEEIARGAPLAIRAMKAVLRMNEGLTIRQAFERELPGRSGIPVYEEMHASEDFLEGPKAFAEKREPVWRGR